MSKQKEKDQQFGMLAQGLFKQLTQPNYPAAGVAFDYARFIDENISEKNVKRRGAILMESAAMLVEYASKYFSNYHSDLKYALFNNAINMVMLVSESYAKSGDEKEAERIFKIAYSYTRKMGIWNEEFPPEKRILSVFSFNEHRGFQRHLCDTEVIREKLVAYHAEFQRLARKISINISLARHILDEASSMRSSALFLFEITCGEETLHLREKTPSILGTASSVLAFGEQYIASIDSERGEETVLNRSKRAIVVANLVRAHVQASLAHAYVAYWKGAKGLENYGVLAHQAISYAEATQESNWEYFAPLALIRDEEPLCDESERSMRCLLRHGECAYAYAMCLHAQMNDLPKRMQPAEFEPVSTPKQTLEPIKPMQWPSNNAWNSDKEEATQAEIAESHRWRTGEDLRENAHYGIGNQNRTYPKQRLVGFTSTRSGKGKKKPRTKK